MLHQRGFETRLASFRYTTVVCLYLFQVIHERFVPSVSGFWRLIEKNSTCYVLKGRVTVVPPVEFFSFDLWVPFRSLDWFLSYFHQSVHYECLQCKCQGRLKDGKQKTLSYHEAFPFQRFVLDVTGQLRFLVRSEYYQKWFSVWMLPKQPCAVHAFCGAFCTQQNFRLANASQDLNQGC